MVSEFCKYSGIIPGVVELNCLLTLFLNNYVSFCVSAFFTVSVFQKSSTIMWRANFMCAQSQMLCVLLFIITLVVWCTRQRASWIRTAIFFHLKWFSCSGSHIGTWSGFSSSVHSPKLATCTHLARNHHVVHLKVLRYDKLILQVRVLIKELT